ncbi:AmmeMemoRadiSam system radical SAM enzyme, partial [Candidatus Pacearchaeota archaeon]|nr:AmmeMemoRadiSam system radical SAM enzyme [Candidatus Pacearchaeota archaeon]
VQCQLCPHFCAIKSGERGKCKARENKQGTLYSLVYNKPCSVAVDPIEKKPFYHFMPGEKALSIATVGCNLKCKQCQNYQISQAKPEDIPFIALTPEQVIKRAKQENCKIISYTYTEPTIFFEYMLDIAKLAKKAGIKNTIVSNGFINPEPLEELCKYIDGANIDLKSINKEFYKNICGARLEPILESLKILKKNNVWLEITNLIIPTLNDKTSELKELVSWVKNNLGIDTPLHFSAFYPCYELSNLQPTSIEKLREARKIGIAAGLNYIYTGNLPDDEGSTTYCPKSKKVAIKRYGYRIIENNIKNGICTCNEKIAGIWK